MITKDLIIIGAGPGGYETALYAARQGLDTLIIEAAELGGTCLNMGCIPTKCLCRNARLLDDLKNAQQWGVTDLSYRFDLRQTIARKDEVVATLRNGIATLLNTDGITLVYGKARFTSSHTITIDDARTSDGVSLSDTNFTAPSIIIATGSSPRLLPVPGARLPGVVTSTEMLSLHHLPRQLCIIGGGVIGMEFASIFSAFGSQVTVLEFCKEILPNFDTDLVKRMRPAFKRSGIQLLNQTSVTSIEQVGDSYLVHYESKGQTAAIPADLVLMAVGRQAHTAHLNLHLAGVVYDEGGISVDEQMQTNVEGVYAVGDVNGQCQLAHAATFQGLRALNHILRRSDDFRFDLIPSVVFTHPEAAAVGPTESECKAQGIAVQVRKAFFRTNGKALTLGEPDGMVKLIADADDTLLAAHIYGPHAADLIHEIVPMIAARCTLRDLASTIHAHPTLSEVVWSAAAHGCS